MGISIAVNMRWCFPMGFSFMGKEIWTLTCRNNNTMPTPCVLIDILRSGPTATVAAILGVPVDAPHDEARRLIAHRLKREQKVAAALAQRGPATVEELVPLAYDDVSPKLHPIAARSLHAHLIKLARDGRAQESGGRWRARPGGATS